MSGGWSKRSLLEDVRSMEGLERNQLRDCFARMFEPSYAILNFALAPACRSR